MECCSCVFNVLKLSRVLFMLHHVYPFCNEPYKFCNFPFSRDFGIMIESLELYSIHGQMRTLTLDNLFKLVTTFTSETLVDFFLRTLPFFLSSSYHSLFSAT